MLEKKSLPFFVSLLGILISFLVSAILQYNQNEHIKGHIKSHAKHVAEDIQGEIISQTLALKRMANRWAIGGKPPRAHWESDAKNQVKDSRLYHAIAWVDSTFRIRWIVPLKGNEEALGLDLSFEEKRKTTLEKARDLRELYITPPVDLVQGGKGILLYEPVYHQKNFEGFIGGVFKVENLLNGILDANRDAGGFSLCLLDGENEIFKRTESTELDDMDWPVFQPVRFYNIEWKLKVWPNPEMVAEEGSAVPKVVLVLGIVVSLLLGTAYYWALRARSRSQEVEVANINLKKEIAERKQIESALQKAHDELEDKVELRTRQLKKSNADLADFASIAAHDLQEPIRKIIGFGDRLKEESSDLNEKSTSYLERMRSAAVRMQRLIDDLLQFAKLDSRRMRVEPIHIGDIINQVIEDLELRISQTNGTVSVSDMPTLEADSFQMRQLFQNLIGNSLKYHREGVPPEIRIESALSENGFWQIRVEDNGIGIDEKSRERIFKPFERLDGGVSLDGTGMGLAICKKIVDTLGGTIEVQSQAGQGTTFILQLPETQIKD